MPDAIVVQANELKLNLDSNLHLMTWNKESIDIKEKTFEEFADEVERIANSILRGESITLTPEEIEKLLNDAVSEELRKRVPLIDRQNMGAFFTGRTLRQRALQHLDNNPETPSVLDPACGAGDLLLGYAERLAVKEDISHTLQDWENKLFAFDLQQNFIKIAKSRLVLLAHHRGAKALSNKDLQVKDTFKNLTQADALQLKSWPQTEEIAINPPYIYIQSENECDWTSGIVSAAAVFIEHCIKKSPQSTRIIGILPEVLRTGTRYKRWRELITSERKLSRSEIYGAFDPQADVDVFILEIMARDDNAPDTCCWSEHTSDSEKKISDLFHVCVGSVVPHRDEEAGELCAYIHTRDAPPWGAITEAPAYREFQGTTHCAPLVIVRRTSSPSDKNRAIGTLVTCPGKIAIENHLIVLKPKNQSIDDCIELLHSLQNESTNDWLNTRIRCRHLTVSAVKEIPLVEHNQ